MSPPKAGALQKWPGWNYERIDEKLYQKIFGEKEEDVESEMTRGIHTWESEGGKCLTKEQEHA
jgi:hypothetical protein